MSAWYNTMNRMISAVVLTKNNEKTIGQTLQSLAWCDERIVIDDFSSDDTASECKKFHVSLYRQLLDRDFSKQRNFGLSKAKGPWVLFVDSDEVVSETLRDEIQKNITQQGIDREGIAGYFIKRDDIFFGKKLKHGETTHIKLLRLAKKNSGNWVRPVHEYWDIKGETRILDTPLVHNSHETISQFISDINTYSTINADYLYTQGTKASTFSILIYPSAKFLQNYFFRLGFLDGTRGCLMALCMSFHSFLTRAKLYLKHHR